MTAVAPPPWAAPRPRWGPGRIVALVLGIVLLLPGLGLLVGGGALLWVDRESRGSDGFVLSASDRFTAPGYALTSDRLDLTTGARWLPVSAGLGEARISVTAYGGQSVFVGIAPAARVQAYLSGVGHTVVRDIGADATSADLATVRGGPPAGTPGDQDFWAARTSGTGEQRLTWRPADGDWMLVVMNADGSAGVSVQARAGATVPALGGIAWAVLAVGVVVTLVGMLLTVLAARRRPAPPQVWTAPADGPPVTRTAWRPPVPRPGAATDVPDPAHPGGAGRPPG